MTSTEDLPITYDVPEAPRPAEPPPPRAPRRVPGWVRWTAGGLCALLAVGASYALGVRSIADDRDEAEAARDEADGSLADAEAALAASRVRLADCTELAESAASLQDAGGHLAAGWREFVRLMDAWALTAVGSKAEAAAAEAVVEQVSEMDTRVGELNAKADGVDGDVSACEAS